MNAWPESISLLLENFHWLRPWWLMGLLPALLLPIYLWRQKRSATQWSSLVSPHLLPFLLDGKSGGVSAAHFWLLGLAWILAVLALAGPAWEKRSLPLQQNQSALVVILDLSPSMLTEDVKPSRLIRARLKIADILRERREGLTALLVYAGEAHVVAPLTDDTATINNLLSALHPDIMPLPGSNTEAAVARSVQLLKDARVPQGDLLLVTDGVVTEARANIRQLLGNTTFRFSVLGVGGDAPAPIPGNRGSFIRDQNNAIVTTQLDAALLRDLADENAGRYSSLTTDDSDISWLLSQAPLLNEHYQQLERDFDTWYDRGYWLVLLLLPAVLYCFRRGVVLGIVIAPLVLHSGESHALQWKDLWLTPDQQGQRALENQQADIAAEAFRDPMWKGTALYRAGDYEAAAEQFATHDTAQAHYNRGNALSKAGKLKEGIQAYEEALKRQPEFPEARANRDLVQALLDQQQQQNQQSQNQQSQNQQSQEQQSQDQQDQDQQDQDQNRQENNQQQQNSQDQQQQSQQDSGSENKENLEHQQSSSAEEQDEQQQADQRKAQEEQAEESAEKNDEQSTSPVAESSEESEAEQALITDAQQISEEEQQALEQWLRRVPDDPSGLLRNKFRYQHNEQRQEQFQQDWQSHDSKSQERW